MSELTANPIELTNEEIENKLNKFEKELEVLINQHSIDNLSKTPDYILANYLVHCLINFNSSVLTRDNWFGNKNSIN